MNALLEVLVGVRLPYLDLRYSNGLSDAWLGSEPRISRTSRPMAALRRLAGSAWRAATALCRWRRRQAAIRQAGSLDDHLLSDIGLQRARLNAGSLLHPTLERSGPWRSHC